MGSETIGPEEFIQEPETTRVMTKMELVEWVYKQKPGVVIGILLAGDRLDCCDEAVGRVVEEEIVSVATIAPQGEYGAGEPAIVALYTAPEHRRKGYGRDTFRAAIARSKERGLPRLRVDVMSSHVMRIIEGLTEEEREFLDVHDLGGVIDRFLE